MFLQESILVFEITLDFQWKNVGPKEKAGKSHCSKSVTVARSSSDI